MKNFIPSSIFSDQQLFVAPETSESHSAGTGSNLKALLVLCRKEEEAGTHQALLGKILGAANFDLHQDIRLIELSEEERFSFSAYRSQNAVKQVIIMGLTPSQLGLHFVMTKYSQLHHLDCDFLLADSLAAISEDRQLKGQLWNAMKLLFNI